MTALSPDHDRGPTAGIRRLLRRCYVWLVGYRYHWHLKRRKLPKSLPGLTDDSIRGKATASIATAGILFGFVAAALATVAGSDEGRKQFEAALEVLQAAGLAGWLGVIAGVLLPYFVARQERYISEATARYKEEEEQARRRRNRTWFLLILLLVTLAFLLLPLVCPALQLRGLFLKSALEISGLLLLGLSLLFLFFSLELYDSAAGWRGGKRLHFHLAGIASHSFLFGATLAIVGLSLLLTFLNGTMGRVAASLSLFSMVFVTEIERDLFLFHKKIESGMNYEEVEDTLGPPSNRWGALEEKVYYQYDDKTLTFERGKVIAVSEHKRKR